MFVARSKTRSGGTPTTFLSPGQVLAQRYRIIKPLGRGGMASVYLAEDIVLQETEVAIKLLSDVSDAMPECRSRFIQEVKLTRKIQHENVVRTFEYGQDGELCFYSMEYLPGAPLSEIMAGGEVDFSTILSIATQLMRGVVAIQGVGVIHRDIKPSNIIVSDDGLVTITDFGIARGESSTLTRNPSQVMGTIAYMAPEILSGGRASRAVDFYALGVVLYELLTGYQPFDEESPARLILKKVEQDPPSINAFRSDLPQWLTQGVMGLLAREPEDRMRSVRDLAKALESCGCFEKTQSLSRQLEDAVANSDVPGQSRFPWSRSGHRGGKQWLVSSLLTTVFAMLTVPLSTTEVSDRLEGAVLDEMFQWRGNPALSTDVMIVAIDEQSYTSLGVPLTAPWPRELHAKLLATLADAGAKLAVFDVLFSDGEFSSGEDLELSMSMRRMPTVLGAALAMSHKATMQGSFLLEEMIRPAPVFDQSAVSIGTVGLPMHRDRVRSFMTERSDVFPDVPSLAQAVVTALGNRDERPGNQDLINFYGPSGTIPTISYETLLRNRERLPVGLFKDKVVFIGLGLRSSTGPSQRDAFVTPYGGGVFGAELHATATANILNREWIRAVPPLTHGLVLFIAAAAIIGCLITLPGLLAIISLAGLISAILTTQFVLFLECLYVPVTTGIVWGCFAGCVLKIVAGTPHAVYVRRRS